MRPFLPLASLALVATSLLPATTWGEITAPGSVHPAVVRPGDTLTVIVEGDISQQGFYGWLELEEFPFPLTVMAADYDDAAANGNPGWRLTMTVPGSITPGFSYPSNLSTDFTDNNQSQYLESAAQGTYDLHIAWNGGASEEAATRSVLVVQPSMGSDWLIVSPTPWAPALVKRGESFTALLNAPQVNGAVSARLLTSFTGLPIEVTTASYNNSALPESCSSGPSGGPGWEMSLTVPEDVPQDLFDLEISIGDNLYTIPASVRVVRTFRDPYTVVVLNSPLLLGTGDDGLGYSPGKILNSIAAYDPDLVVVAGNLSLNRLPEEYLYLQKLLGLLHRPTLVVPGPSDFYDTLNLTPDEVSDGQQLDANEAGYCRFGSRLPYFSLQYGEDLYYALSATSALEPDQLTWLDSHLASDSTVGTRTLVYASCDATYGVLDSLCDDPWLADRDVDYVISTGATGGVALDQQADIYRVTAQAWEGGYGYVVQFASDGSVEGKETITASQLWTSSYWAQDNDGLRDANSLLVTNIGEFDLSRREVAFDLVGGRYACSGDGDPEIVEILDADDETVTRVYVQYDLPAGAEDYVISCTRTEDIPHKNLSPVANAGESREVIDDDHDGFETIVLSAALSYDEDGTVTAWDWNVGGVSYEGENVTATLDIGEHLASLTVTDDGGASATAEVTITVTAGEFAPPPEDEGCGACASQGGSPQRVPPAAAILAFAGLGLAILRRRVSTR